jgi:hypothetical protein
MSNRLTPKEKNIEREISKGKISKENKNTCEYEVSNENKVLSSTDCNLL